LDAKDYIKMPPIKYNKIPVYLTPKLKKQYKQLEDDFFMEFDGAEATAFNAAALSSKLRQYIQGQVYDEFKVAHHIHDLKFKALDDIIDASAGQSILCPIQFRFELDAFKKKFGNIPIIAGGTNPRMAMQYINQWNKGEIPLLLCHPAALSHGLNLQTGGHIVVWFGMTWSLEQYLQLNGRLHRRGQKNAVVVNHLVMDGTIDEAVMRAIETKGKGLRTLLNELRAYSRRRHLHK
jgi:hypothetical protein